MRYKTFNVNTNHLSNHTNINGGGVNALIFKDVACDEKMVVLGAYEYPKQEKLIMISSDEKRGTWWVISNHECLARKINYYSIVNLFFVMKIFLILSLKPYFFWICILYFRIMLHFNKVLKINKKTRNPRNTK